MWSFNDAEYVRLGVRGADVTWPNLDNMTDDMIINLTHVMTDDLIVDKTVNVMLFTTTWRALTLTPWRHDLWREWSHE